MTLDKLKVLANNEKELWEARKTIAFREAIKNGHDMSEWLVEIGWGYGQTDYYTCHCKKCVFELCAEIIQSGSGMKYYFNYKSTKCPAI